MSKDIEKYAATIKLLVPINELSSQVQNELTQKAKFIKLRKGKFLFKQGDTDNFSFYLLEGELELLANKQLQNTVGGGSDRARYAMAQLQPRQMSAKAKTPVTVLQIERDALDKFMVSGKAGAASIEVDDGGFAVSEMEVSEIDGEDDVDWMTKMLQSELFLKMPMANMHQLFAVLEAVEYKPGDIIARQGEAGEHYFIIQEGRCEVSRKASADAKDIKLADLKAGDSFGEEALLMDTTRNATVTMTQEGIVAQLSKDNFIELIKKPTLASVKFKKAEELVDAGALWLDVRYENEYKESNIQGAKNIPLNILRMQTDKLAMDKQYIVYCDTGGRSSAGAFLLAKHGFQACYLEGGLISNPDASISVNEVVEKTEEKKAKAGEPPQTEAKPKVEAKQKTRVEEPAKEAVVKKEEPKKAEAKKEKAKEVPPEVREAAIDVELERTNIKLQEAEKLREEVNAVKQKAQKEIKQKLEEERKKLQLAKKEAEDEIKKLREDEEKKVEKMKAETEKRLQEEKKKLEDIYTKNAEDMQEIQQLKEQAEEEAKKKAERLKIETEQAQKKMEEAELLKEEEKKKMEKESSEAKKMLEEARRLKEEVEASRKSMEKEAEEKAKDHEELQKKLQDQARVKIEEEKRKLAEQLTKNNEVLEQAQKEKDQADAVRKAAHEEAERIIEEYKKEHEAVSAAKEDELRKEQEKLEEESDKIQSTLLQIQEEKLNAEQEKLDAQKQVAMLKIKQQQKSSKSDKKDIKEEIKAIEEKVDVASKHLEEVEDAEKQAESAKELNSEGIQKHTEEVAKLRDEVREDLESFIKEQEEMDKSAPKFETDPEYMKRLQERAEEAKKQEVDATANLFADISSLLSSEED